MLKSSCYVRDFSIYCWLCKVVGWWKLNFHWAALATVWDIFRINVPVTMPHGHYIKTVHELPFYKLPNYKPNKIICSPLDLMCIQLSLHGGCLADKLITPSSCSLNTRLEPSTFRLSASFSFERTKRCFYWFVFNF